MTHVTQVKQRLRNPLGTLAQGGQAGRTSRRYNMVGRSSIRQFNRLSNSGRRSEGAYQHIYTCIIHSRGSNTRSSSPTSAAAVPQEWWSAEADWSCSILPGWRYTSSGGTCLRQYIPSGGTSHPSGRWQYKLPAGLSMPAHVSPGNGAEVERGGALASLDSPSSRAPSHSPSSYHVYIGWMDLR